MLKKLIPLVFLFAGFQVNAGIISDYDKVTAANDGWSVLYQGDGDWTFDMAHFLSGITTGTTFALATSSHGDFGTYDLFGSTSLNLLDIRGSIPGDTTPADGAHWYWNHGVVGSMGSLGFTDLAIVGHDIDGVDGIPGDLRLSWMTSSDDLVGDRGRSGDNLAIGSSWERYVLVQASVPEPSIIALFGLGLVGIGFARRRQS
jgi:hypothetical protein